MEGRRRGSQESSFLIPPSFCQARNTYHAEAFPVAVVIEVVVTILICLVAFFLLQYLDGARGSASQEDAATQSMIPSFSGSEPVRGIVSNARYYSSVLPLPASRLQPPPASSSLLQPPSASFSLL
jgi:hypothetical protein